MMLPSRMDTRAILTRREIVVAELDAAIESLFLREDLIAAHLLAWAAFDLITDIAKRKDVKTLRAAGTSKMPPETAKLWKLAERDHYNFMKHADRDPERRIRLIPGMTLFTLYVAVRDYQAVFGEGTLPMGIYLGWYALAEPDTAMAMGIAEAARDLFADGLADTWEEARRLLQLMADVKEPLGGEQ